LLQSHYMYAEAKLYRNPMLTVKIDMITLSQFDAKSKHKCYYSAH